MGVCVCECVRVHGHAYTQYHNVCVCVHGCVSVPVILLTGGHFSPFFLSGMSSVYLREDRIFKWKLYISQMHTCTYHTHIMQEHAWNREVICLPIYSLHSNAHICEQMLFGSQ